jgi:hypothetical protein
MTKCWQSNEREGDGGPDSFNLQFPMRLTLILATTLVACVAPPADTPPPRALHGTYAVWICAQGCALADTASAPVAGFLVLNQLPLPLDGFSEEMLEESLFFLRPGETATACFHLMNRVKGRSSLAGIQPRAATRWTQRGDTVRVLLFASPDAFYHLTAVVRDGRLVGSGRESGFVGMEFDNPGGEVHGVRIGPADVRRCQATTS